MQAVKLIGLLVLAGILAMTALILIRVAPRINATPQPMITTFEECAAAGNPVMESYPRQCRTEDGRLFSEEIGEKIPDGMVSNGCAVAGCSQHLCVSVEEAATIVTTCEYRAEYACYREASCEPQVDGKCGWTQSAGLAQCLASPPEIQPEVQ
jgi:hypothetical protein